MLQTAVLDVAGRSISNSGVGFGLVAAGRRIILRCLLVASIIRLFRNAFERLAILLLIHDTTGFCIALCPISVWSLELSAIIDGSLAETVTRIFGHFNLLISSRHCTSGRENTIC